MTSAFYDEIASHSLSNTTGHGLGADAASLLAIDNDHDPVQAALPLVPTDTHWGLDTVRLSYRISPHQCDPLNTIWHRSSTRATSGEVADQVRGSVRVGHGGARIFLWMLRGICHVEFNAARALNADPLYLLPPDALRPLVEGIIWDLHEAVWPAFLHVDGDGVLAMAADWPSHVKVKRLDIARDFHVSDSAIMRRALATVDSRYQKHKAINTSAGDGWTLYNRSTRSGLERFYDKHAETMAKSPTLGASVPKGTYRLESVLRYHRLDRAGLTRLADVGEQAVWEALQHRWEQTRWGNPITSGGGLQAALRDSSTAAALSALGFVASEALGGVIPCDSRKRREMMAKCRALGLSPGLPLEEQGGTAVRLNLYSGRLERIDP